MISFSVVSAGRRFSHLIARLSELSSALTDLGIQSSLYIVMFSKVVKRKLKLVMKPGTNLFLAGRWMQIV